MEQSDDLITREAADEAFERLRPLISPALDDCLSKAVKSAITDGGSFDDEKFQASLKKCVTTIYVGHNRVTVGKAAAIAQALFFAMLARM